MLRLIKKACGISWSGCPGVYAVEDGTGDLLIVGISSGLVAIQNDVHLSPGEHAVRISRALVEEALLPPTEREGA